MPKTLTLHAGKLFTLLLLSADFFQNKFLKSLSEALSECNSLDPNLIERHS